ANLASVCFHLERPVEAARHASRAIVWLEGKESPYGAIDEPTEAEEHESAEKVTALRALIDLVTPEVGTIRIQRCHYADAVIVDGVEIDRCPWTDGAHDIYVEPGSHDLEIREEDELVHRVHVDVRAGV